MTKQTKITPSNCARYSNPLHTMFHEAMYEIIKGINTGDLSRWRIQDTLPEWRGLIDIELDINRETSASAETKLLEVIDQKRDRLIIYLFEMIRVERLYSPDEARAEAGRRLGLITKEYAGLQREGYNEQTVHTDGLIKDLQKTENLDDMKTLKLDQHLTDLEQYNSEFKHRLTARSDQKAATKLPAAREIRPQSDTCYYRVCELLGAAFIYATDDTERERINEIIRRMNQRTEEIKARHRQTQTTAKKKTASASATSEVSASEVSASVGEADGE